MTSKATTVEEYLASIPEERRPYFDKLREVVLANLPKGFEETIQYGMIGYVVPLATYPAGYHVKKGTPLPFAHLASQKNYIGLYHSGIYSKKELSDWFVAEYPNHAKRKLDMGKSCIRLKKMEDIPYELIGELMQKLTVEDWIAQYEKSIKK